MAGGVMNRRSGEQIDPIPLERGEIAAGPEGERVSPATPHPDPMNLLLDSIEQVVGGALHVDEVEGTTEGTPDPGRGPGGIEHDDRRRPLERTRE